MGSKAKKKVHLQFKEAFCLTHFLGYYPKLSNVLDSGLSDKSEGHPSPSPEQLLQVCYYSMIKKTPKGVSRCNNPGFPLRASDSEPEGEAWVAKTNTITLPRRGCI